MDYPPQIRSISLMVQELCESLVEMGHDVTVLTSFPRENISEEDAKKTYHELSMESGVRVVRVKTPRAQKGSYVLRGLKQMMLPSLFIQALKRHVPGDIGAVVVYSPKLPLVKVGNYIKRQYGARYVLNIQDLFPQAAIDLGILKNYHVIRFFERMEENAYASADAITTCTRGARKFLIDEKDLPAEKVTLVPNWIDVEPYLGAPKRDFRHEWELGDDTVFVFPGNFGPSQGLDFVVELAARVKDLTRVKFLFVGDGSERAHLEMQASDLGASNVIFKPFVSPTEYPDLLKACDVGLLVLKADCKTPAVPGKFFSFLAASLPVVGLLNPESEGHELIRESQSGYALVPDDLSKAEQLIRQIVSNQDAFKRKGELGHRYVKEHFGKEVCIRKLEQLVNQ